MEIIMNENEGQGSICSPSLIFILAISLEKGETEMTRTGFEYLTVHG
jgi:hypothetical protein